jgi:hypothetical protein
MKFRASDPCVREHPDLFLPADSSDGEILEARRARHAALMEAVSWMGSDA